MRTSHYLMATVKETPTDAVIASHQLMLRAGMIRKLASGLYDWLPTGLRVLRKAEQIVREEMDRAGALEILMPMVQPMELWDESGRGADYGPELLRVDDRHHNRFCLGPTHEEVITDLVRNEVHSYKQLPLNFYQIQTKFRDERRPRFGIMRAREFLMKDAYSFHLDQASLEATYEAMHHAYCRIFDRMGLDYRAVEADTGAMGGSQSHEFHVLAESGEDAIVFSDQSDYAANLELAEAVSASAERAEPGEPMRLVDTPDVGTIDDLTRAFGLAPEDTVKTLVVHADESASHSLIALMVRGDHELNEHKAERQPGVQAPLQLATDAEIRTAVGAGAGSVGPVGLPLPVFVDRSVAVASDFAAGANIDGQHYFGINWHRDQALPDVADLREVREGDPSPDGRGKLTLRRGIEVGHVFQLGTKYSDALSATVLDDNGKDATITMGCYGIGVSRVVAAAIEQNHDEQGIIWPEAIAPFQVALIPLNPKKSPRERDTCEQLYARLTQAGYDVLFDDREKERVGVKFSDTELMGIPHRVLVTEKGLDEGHVEYKHRRSGDVRQVELDAIETAVAGAG